MKGERVARRLRAVQLALMDNFPVDEKEPACLKETSLCSLQTASASFETQGKLEGLKHNFSTLPFLHREADSFGVVFTFTDGQGYELVVVVGSL